MKLFFQSFKFHLIRNIILIIVRSSLLCIVVQVKMSKRKSGIPILVRSRIMTCFM